MIWRAFGDGGWYIICGKVVNNLSRIRDSNLTFSTHHHEREGTPPIRASPIRIEPRVRPLQQRRSSNYRPAGSVG